jgi:hypothetical protein
MQFAIKANLHLVTKGETDNPYQARNIIRQYVPPTFKIQDSHTLITPNYNIWTSCEVIPLLAPTPKIINDAHQIPQNSPNLSVGPSITLAQLCNLHDLDPTRCRRILRRHYGSHHCRYEWPINEAPLALLKKLPKIAI